MPSYLKGKQEILIRLRRMEGQIKEEPRFKAGVFAMLDSSCYNGY